MSLAIAWALLTGLFGSLHCLGMCGPLAAAVGGSQGVGFRARMALFLTGKLLTYTCLGAAAGALGGAFGEEAGGGPRALGVVAVLAGFAMIWLGLDGVRRSTRFAGQGTGRDASLTHPWISGDLNQRAGSAGACPPLPERSQATGGAQGPALQLVNRDCRREAASGEPASEDPCMREDARPYALDLKAGLASRRPVERPSPVGVVLVHVLQAGGRAAPLLAGAFAGLLPCGPVHAMLAQAVALGSVWGGSAVMLAFGAGTSPALAAAGLLSGCVAGRWRSAGEALAASSIVAMGTLAIWRGLTVLTAAAGATPTCCHGGG